MISWVATKLSTDTTIDCETTRPPEHVSPTHCSRMESWRIYYENMAIRTSAEAIFSAVLFDIPPRSCLIVGPGSLSIILQTPFNHSDSLPFQCFCFSFLQDE